MRPDRRRRRGTNNVESTGDHAKNCLTTKEDSILRAWARTPTVVVLIDDPS